MTFGEAQTFVLDRLQIPSSDTAKVTQIKTLINLETARVNVEYDLTIASAAVTITGTTGVVALPADFQRAIWMTQTSVVVEIVDELQYAARTAAIAGGSSPTITNPPTFAVFRPSAAGGGSLYTLPAPTSNVSATLVYVARPATMTSDATAIPLPVEYHDLIAERAVRRMALTEGESAIAQIALDISNELAGRLSAIRNLQGGISSWQIPLVGYQR